MTNKVKYNLGCNSSIIDEQNRKHIFKKDRGKIIYKEDGGEEKTVSDKNNRLEEVLKQLGTGELNGEDEDIINCRDKDNFQREISELKEQSKVNKTIIKKFRIPGHAFVMVFKNDKAYCFDNGAIKNKHKSYYSVLTSEKV